MPCLNTARYLALQWHLGKSPEQSGLGIGRLSPRRYDAKTPRLLLLQQRNMRIHTTRAGAADAVGGSVRQQEEESRGKHSVHGAIVMNSLPLF